MNPANIDLSERDFEEKKYRGRASVFSQTGFPRSASYEI